VLNERSTGLMSPNMCGLGGRAQKLSLRRLVDVDRPYVVLLQESMGRNESIILDLQKLFSGWGFLVVDVDGHSSGLL
jgi:hypothetical protein